MRVRVPPPVPSKIGELVNVSKLKKHVNLCMRNLRSRRVKCCADCPFEEEIVGEYPELKKFFKEKRKICGPIAQMGEHWSCKPEDVSSTLARPTIAP